MRTGKLFVLALTTLAVMAAMSFSSPALADCGKKSNHKSMNRMSDMQDMEMSDDMPMCCKMKMDHTRMKGHKSKSQAEKDEGDSKLESMGEHEMPGMTDDKEAQAGKKQTKEVKDLVCSMTVDPKTAEKSVYKGKTYYFCSKEDKATFEKAPAKYATQKKSNK